jgi:hypothetical protein
MPAHSTNAPLQLVSRQVPHAALVGSKQSAAQFCTVQVTSAPKQVAQASEIAAVR